MMTFVTRAALSAGLALLATAVASAGEPFSPAYSLPPLSSGPESTIALAARGDWLLFGSPAEGALGAAAVFNGSSGALRFALPHSSAGEVDQFGRAVAIGPRWIAVGAPWSKAVYVYDARGRWVRTIESPSSSDFSDFGRAIAIAGDGLAVGDPFAGGDERGEVVLYDLASGALVRRIAGTTAGEHLGWALAASGSLIAAGAPQTLADAGIAGAVVAIDAASGEVLWRISSGAAAGDFFGGALAADGGRLLVGAPLDDTRGPDAGAVYAVRRRDGAILGAIANPTGQADRFGAAVAVGGGVVAIGAPEADSIETDTGLVHVFAPSGRLLQSLDPSPTTYCAAAGGSVAAGTGWLAVGATDCFGDSTVHVYARRAPFGARPTIGESVRLVRRPVSR